MHVADGALLIALATIFVSLEATWTALAFEIEWVPFAPMGPFLATLANRFQVPWLKASAAARLTAVVCNPRRYLCDPKFSADPSGGPFLMSALLRIADTSRTSWEV